MYRPRVLINIIILNPTEDKILMVKKHANSFWSLMGGILNFGEEFHDCARRVLNEEAKLLIEDQKKIEFICTYNAVDKEKQLHYISIDYLFQTTKNEYAALCSSHHEGYLYWKWISLDEMKKLDNSLFFAVKLFFKKFQIKEFKDIKTIHSN